MCNQDQNRTSQMKQNFPRDGESTDTGTDSTPVHNGIGGLLRYAIAKKKLNPCLSIPRSGFRH